MNEEELNRLIEKYYNGTSTEIEENALRRWFSENPAPEGYEAEHEIFSYFSAEEVVPEPSAGFEARIISAIDNSESKGGSDRIRRFLLPALSAAAGILIIAGSYFFFVNRTGNEDTFTDPKIAYAETMKILMDVSSQINHGTRPLKPVGRINEIKSKGFESINKSAGIVEKNLRNLEYLRNPE